MKITRDIEQLSPGDNPVVTIGNFDGVHLGHQALLNEVVRKAQSGGGDSVVLTFDPHPLSIVAPHLIEGKHSESLNKWASIVQGGREQREIRRGRQKGDILELKVIR